MLFHGPRASCTSRLAGMVGDSEAYSLKYSTSYRESCVCLDETSSSDMDFCLNLFSVKLTAFPELQGVCLKSSMNKLSRRERSP